jgi:hypothetical protein
MKKNKKAMEMQMLMWWLIGIAALVFIVLGIIVLKGKGQGALAFIQNLFRFKSV